MAKNGLSASQGHGVCQHPTSISERLQTPSSAFVCFLLFSFRQKICPEKTCLLVPATKTPCRGRGDPMCQKLIEKKLQSKLQQTVYLACPKSDMFLMSNLPKAQISSLHKNTTIQKDVLASNTYTYTIAIQCSPKTTKSEEGISSQTLGVPVHHPWGVLPQSRGWGHRTQNEPKISCHHHVPHTRANALQLLCGYSFKKSSLSKSFVGIFLLFTISNYLLLLKKYCAHDMR